MTKRKPDVSLVSDSTVGSGHTVLPDIEDLCQGLHETHFHTFGEKDKEEVRSSLLEWYDREHRVLPWRYHQDDISRGGAKSKDPYAVWVSELMLQQTRVETVIPYFKKWMNEFPTVQALARAPLERVNELWAGLGYYRRARFLHEGAKKCVAEMGGVLPNTVEDITKVPGVGSYTAGAICSISSNVPVPVVDGNVIRVLARMRAIGLDQKSNEAVKVYWELARGLVDPDRPGDFNQSMMELGATVCTPKNPSCQKCPVSSHCHAKAEEEAYKKSVTPLAKKTKTENGGRAKTRKSSCAVCAENSDLLKRPVATVTLYPPKAPKTAQREDFMVSMVLECTGDDGESKYLLIRRPDKGLLAGLWEFPTYEIGETSWENATKRLEGLKNAVAIVKSPKVNCTKAKDCGEVTHIFSHIRMLLAVYRLVLDCDEECVRLADGRDARWMSAREITDDAALPELSKKVYRASSGSIGGKKSNASSKKKSAGSSAGQASISSFFSKK